MKNVAETVQNVWEFEDRQISLLPTSAILVRIMIGKVADDARLRETFAKTPIRAGCDGYEGWNCVSWAQEALSWVVQDNTALGSCHTNWVYVKNTAMWYVAKKVAEHRFDGQGQFDQGKIPDLGCNGGERIDSLRGNARGNQNSPKYIRLSFSIPNSASYGSKNLPTSFCQKRFWGLACHAVVYSQ